jgi:acyl-CoA reductase-like NAD-dependent aldehyde dehydrogenase
MKRPGGGLPGQHGRGGGTSQCQGHDRADRFIAPTVLVNVSPDSPVTQEEIFGPILPVLEVDNVQQVIDFVNARPSPLGLYVFAEDQHVAEHGSTADALRGEVKTRQVKALSRLPGRVLMQRVELGA